MKKLVSMLLVLAMMLCVFGVSVAEEAVPAYDGSEVTITFYNTMGSNLTTVLDAYIAEFNAIYPNIHIEYTSVGG